MRCWNWSTFAARVALFLLLTAPVHGQQWPQATGQYYDAQAAAQPANGVVAEPAHLQVPHPCTSPLACCDEANCGCMGCGMGGCGMTGCGPLLRFSFDALWLERNEPEIAVLATDDATGATLLSGANLNSGKDDDWRFGAMFHFHEYSALQFVWMSSNWNAGATAVGAVNAIAGTLDFQQANSIAILNSSEFESFELNKLWLTDSGLGWLVGVRHVSFDDSFLMRATDAGRTSNYSIRTDSDWSGMQIGAFYEQCLTGGLCFRSQMKLGLGQNDVQQAVLLRDNNNTVTLRNFRNGDSDHTWLAELDVGLMYRLNRVTIRAGYELLWLDGVALAPDQFQNNSAGANAAISANGRFLATGFYAGLEIAF